MTPASVFRTLTLIVLATSQAFGQWLHKVQGNLEIYESGSPADSISIYYQPNFPSYKNANLAFTDPKGNFEISWNITKDSLKIVTPYDYCDIIIYGLVNEFKKVKSNNSYDSHLGKLLLFNKFTGGHLSYEHLIRAPKKFLGIVIKKEKGYSNAVEHGFCDPNLYGVIKRTLDDGAEILVSAGIVYIRYGI